MSTLFRFPGGGWPDVVAARGWRALAPAGMIRRRPQTDRTALRPLGREGRRPPFEGGAPPLRLEARRVTRTREAEPPSELSVAELRLELIDVGGGHLPGRPDLAVLDPPEPEGP